MTTLIYSFNIKLADLDVWINYLYFKFCCINKDFIITLYRDSPDECTCDVSFPNMKQLDSIFAFIYSASRGYYLVNISTNEVVKVKLNPEDPLELEDKMVIIFGNGHSFTIEIQDGLRSGNNILKQIKVMEIKNAKQR